MMILNTNQNVIDRKNDCRVSAESIKEDIGI